MGFCIALLGASPSRKGCWVCSSPWPRAPLGAAQIHISLCAKPGQMLNPEFYRFCKGVLARWVFGSARGGWCRCLGVLRWWCWCVCRGGTRHPHRRPPALPAAPAGAPRPGEVSVAGLVCGPWHVGETLCPCIVVGPQSNPCSPWGLVPPGGGSGQGCACWGLADHAGVGAERVGAPGTCNEAEPSQFTALVPKWECFPWESLHKLFVESKICSSRSAVCKLFAFLKFFLFKKKQHHFSCNAETLSGSLIMLYPSLHPMHCLNPHGVSLRMRLCSGRSCKAVAAN